MKYPMKMCMKLVIAVVATGLGCPLIDFAQLSAKSADPTKSYSPDAHGFIQNWTILEPIHLATPQLTESAVQAAAKHEYFEGQLTSLPKDGEKVMVDGADLMCML